MSDQHLQELLSADPEAFDGHTEFLSLSHSQRIQWLGNAARFWFAAHPAGSELNSEQVGTPESDALF
jgi:hypothetical protein